MKSSNMNNPDVLLGVLHGERRQAAELVDLIKHEHKLRIIFSTEPGGETQYNVLMSIRV